jgi:hypothetical protein
MHRFRWGIAGIVLASVIAGCGGSSVDEGPRDFTPTDTKQLDTMVKEMQGVAKTKAYLQKAVPTEKEKPKEADKK